MIDPKEISLILKSFSKKEWAEIDEAKENAFRISLSEIEEKDRLAFIKDVQLLKRALVSDYRMNLPEDLDADTIKSLIEKWFRDNKRKLGEFIGSNEMIDDIKKSLIERIDKSGDDKYKFAVRVFRKILSDYPICRQ